MKASSLKALTADTLTAAILRAEGLDLVPIDPSGALNEEVLADYLAKGRPRGDFFGDYKLVSPEDWEARKQGTPVTKMDPVSGEVMSADVAVQWAAMAPIKVFGGGIVAAVDLIAYAAAKGHLGPAMSSDLLRSILPTGTDAISAPPVLAKAAKEWPYDPQAQSVATARQTQPQQMSARAEPQAPTQPTATISQPLGTRYTRATNLLCRAFSADEMRRVVWRLPHGESLSRELATGKSPAQTASDIVDILERHGQMNDLLNAVLLARPHLGAEIAQLLKDYSR